VAVSVLEGVAPALALLPQGEDTSPHPSPLCGEGANIEASFPLLPLGEGRMRVLFLLHFVEKVRMRLDEGNFNSSPLTLPSLPVGEGLRNADPSRKDEGFTSRIEL
jgi:hypothetical protein